MKLGRTRLIAISFSLVTAGCTGFPGRPDDTPTQLQAGAQGSGEGVQTSRTRVAIGTKFIRRHAALSPADQARVDDNCPFGLPKLAEEAAIPTQLVCRDGFVLEHSAVDKIPLWVAERVTKAEADGQMDRSDNFRPDPRLPKGSRAELSDYRGSGYDRGHMAPAGDQNQNARLKDETFFLSNMSPQDGDLNRKIWKELEQEVRDWAVANGEAHVITGGIFYDPKEDNPESADGVVNYTAIGRNAVGVPTHFYKIIIGKNSEDKLQAIAFLMQNRGQRQPYRFDKYVTSIDWLEDHTGLDFMPDLDPVVANRLEAQRTFFSTFFGGN